MLYTDFTSKLLEMKDMIVNFVTHKTEIVKIHLPQQQKKCRCPACGKTENSAHAYRHAAYQRHSNTSAKKLCLPVHK